MILCPPDLVLLVRSGPVIRDLGGSVRIWGDNGPVLISYFYDGAVPVKVFQNRSQSDFYMDNGIVFVEMLYFDSAVPLMLLHGLRYMRCVRFAVYAVMSNLYAYVFACTLFLHAINSWCY